MPLTGEAKKVYQREYEQQVRDILLRATGGIPWSTVPMPLSAIQQAKKLLEVTGGK